MTPNQGAGANERPGCWFAVGWSVRTDLPPIQSRSDSRRRLRIRRLLLAVLISLTTAAFAIWWLMPRGQPSFQGQTVAWWFAKLASQTNPWPMQYIWLEPASASDARARVFRHDLEAFHKMGPQAVPYLVSRLQDRRGGSSPSYQQFYARIPLWGRTLLRPPRDAEQVRRTADLILKQLGPDAYPAVPALVHALQRGDFRERLEAVNILKGVGSSASNALPALMGILSGTNAYLRVASADAVRHIAPARTEEMLQVYREALQSKEESVRMAAVASIWEATREPQAVIPTLTRMLGDYGSGIFACTILKRCGRSASNAVPALLRQLAASRLDLRVSAAAALSSVAPDTESHRVAETLAAGKAAGLLIGGLEYDAPGYRSSAGGIKGPAMTRAGVWRQRGCT